MNREKFLEELKKIEIELNDKQAQQLELYYQILIEENNKTNLTRIIEKEEVYLKHFYDSLTLVKIIDLEKEGNLCDIGSGAGFPGVVLKIFYPNLNVVLIDSLNKRITFLNQLIEKLKLEKIEAIHARAEEYSLQNEEKFDIVVSRAVAKIPVLLEISAKMVKKDKNIICMKSEISQEIKSAEISAKVLNLKLEKTDEFYLPIENSKRTLILYKKMTKTPKEYPRKFDQIKKKPL